MSLQIRGDVVEVLQDVSAGSRAHANGVDEGHPEAEMGDSIVHRMKYLIAPGHVHL
jgi:hypothetical protein